MGQPRPTRLGRAGVIFERVESRVLCSTAGIVELGPRHLTARDLIAGDRYVYFQGVTEEHGAELWRTDVTPAGTALVRDIAPGRGSSHVRMLATVNDKVFFAAYEGSGSSEVASIWTSDGTAEGTVLVKRGIAPSAFLGTSFAFNGQAFFSARNTGARNPGLWRSDGTAKGNLPRLTPGQFGRAHHTERGVRVGLVQRGSDVHGYGPWPGGMAERRHQSGDVPARHPFE